MRYSVKMMAISAVMALSCGFSNQVVAKVKEESKPHPLANIPLRNIGPAMISGRISDFAFKPGKKHEFYVATSSGNL